MTMFSSPSTQQWNLRIAEILATGTLLVGIAACRPAATETSPTTDASAQSDDHAAPAADGVVQPKADDGGLRKVANAPNRGQPTAQAAPADPPVQAEVDDATQDESAPAEETDQVAAALEPGEYWDATYIGDAKVGHFHTQILPLEEGDRKLLKIAQDGHLTVKRFGTTITQSMAYASVETPEGELLRCETAITLGPSPVSMRGDVEDRSLEVVLSSFGKKTKKTLAWNPEWGGFFAAEQSMRRQPMKPGEIRKFKALMPMATDVAIGDVTLTAHDFETVDLLDGQRKLLKVTVSQEVGGPADTETTAWIDKNGDSMKQFMPGMNLTTYRVSRERAVGEADAGFDLGKFSTVEIDKPLEHPHLTKRIVYQITLQGSDPAKVFSSSGSQQVKSLGVNEAQVTVAAVRPNDPAELPVKAIAPTKKDLASNNLIQTDDVQVVEMARSIAPRETDAWKLATALEQGVHEKVRSKNFSTAFATAAEVARRLEGDCTEHAVLLAALCRARKIPARVAIGLVYYPAASGFAFHMWNEAWIDDRWVPLDATLGQGGIGAAHLKLADSDLDGTDAYSTFLPVAKVMGQLKIEVMAVE